MTNGKTVVHINIDKIKIKDIQDVSVVITTKDNTKILYNKWYMTEQEEPVLDKIRAEIEKAIWEDVVVTLDGTDETRIPRLDPDEVLEIIDKYKVESEDNG